MAAGITHGFGMCCEEGFVTLQTILEPRNSKLEQASKTIPTPLTHSPRVFYRMGEGGKGGPGGDTVCGLVALPAPFPLTSLRSCLSFPLWSRSHVHTALCSPLVPLSFYQLPTPKTLLCSSGPAPSQRPGGPATSCEKICVPLVRKSCLSHFLRSLRHLLFSRLSHCHLCVYASSSTPPTSPPAAGPKTSVLCTAARDFKNRTTDRPLSRTKTFPAAYAVIPLLPHPLPLHSLLRTSPESVMRPLQGGPLDLDQLTRDLHFPLGPLLPTLLGIISRTPTGSAPLATPPEYRGVQSLKSSFKPRRKRLRA